MTRYPDPTRMTTPELAAHAATLIYPPNDPRHTYPEPPADSPDHYAWSCHLGAVRAALRNRRNRLSDR